MSAEFASVYLPGAAPLPLSTGELPHADDTTIADAAQLLSPQLLQDARSDKGRGWAARALCAGADPEDFFPSGDDPAIEARAILRGMPGTRSVPGLCDHR